MKEWAKGGASAEEVATRTALVRAWAQQEARALRNNPSLQFFQGRSDLGLSRKGFARLIAALFPCLLFFFIFLLVYGGRIFGLVLWGRGRDRYERSVQVWSGCGVGLSCCCLCLTRGIRWRA